MNFISLTSITEVTTWRHISNTASLAPDGTGVLLGEKILLSAGSYQKTNNKNFE
jgi:hypothetical protein